MRRIITVICCLWALGVAAQSTQSGVVLEYQGEKAKRPMAGVAITAAGAASTMSDAEGKFTLNFRTLKAGDAIAFKRIEKSGYEIMNKEAVEAARVSRNPQKTSSRNSDNSGKGKPEKAENRQISIILCRTSLLNEIRDGYRTVAAQRYEKKMKASAAELERLREDGKIKEEEYNLRIDSLESAFEEQLLSMETYIDRFARIDLSELDETEKQIIALVQEGSIDEAIQRYDDLRLTEKLRRNAEERETLRQAREKVRTAEEKKTKEMEAIEGSMEQQKEVLKRE